VQDVLKRQVDDVVRRSGARHLNEELFSERLKRGPKAVVTIWYAPNDTEAFRFSEQIYRAVRAANWSVSEPMLVPADAGEPELKNPNAPPAARFSGAESLSGITVLAKNASSLLGHAPRGLTLTL